MHKAAAGGTLTDSMRMFNMGVEGGKPVGTTIGVQPEWFYKGDGSHVIATDTALPSPAFALDGSEEPEIAGIYVIDADGNPRRLGYCLANEFSDHITERGNYLWLAHSKLRPAGLGAELLTGELPSDIRGTTLVLQDAELSVPSNCQTAIAAKLKLANEFGTDVSVELDFLEPGEHRWNIDIETDDGHLQLSKGGAVVTINGKTTLSTGDIEYKNLYAHFAQLVAENRIDVDVDVAPLTLVADAYLSGRRIEVAPFIE